VFAQRMGQLALLRTVGAPRRSLVGALLAEGAVTGAVAGILGVTAGLGLAYAATAVLDALGHTVASPGFPAGTAAACLAGAVLVTIAAVLAPAVAAARVRPLEALRSSAVADTAPRVGWVRLGLGALLLAAAALAAVPVLTNDGSRDPQTLLLVVVASGLAAFGALVALGPIVTPPLARLVGWPLVRAGGVPGQLAVRGALRSPRRVAATTVVVTLGVTLVTGVLVGSASLRGYADEQLASEFPSDLLVTTVDDSAVPAPLIRTLQSDGRIARVVPVREADALIRAGGEDTQLRVKGLAVRDVPALSRAAVDAGDLDSVAPGRIALARSIGSGFGVGVGDTVTVTVGKQHLTATVAAVYDESDALGPALVDEADLRRLAPALAPTSLLVDVRDRSADGIDAVRAAAVRAAGQGSPVTVLTPASLRAEIDQVLTIVSGIALGLLGLTLLIAVVGVATTMALAVVERTREFGLLRALGLGRRGLQASIALESCLFGVVGAVLGLGLGVLYGWLGLESLGLSAPLVLPLGSLAGTAALLAGLAALAGLLPSRRAARTAPVAALAAD
jgi:putative ABC transport system permease protein